MQSSRPKTASVIVVITVILLASGNVLMAEEQPSGNLITAADLAFIKKNPEGIATPRATADRLQPVGMITAADFAFVAQPFIQSSGSHRANADVTFETIGLITAADYEFLVRGQAADVFTAYSDFADYPGSFEQHS